MRTVKDYIMLAYVSDEVTEEITKSGIIINSKDRDRQKPIEGKVISVGNEVKEVKEGDTIVYTEQYSTIKEIQDKKYVFLREGDILCIL